MARNVQKTWMNIHEAATYMGVSERRIQRGRRHGKLRAQVLGYRTIRYRRQDLDEFMRLYRIGARKGTPVSVQQLANNRLRYIKRLRQQIRQYEEIIQELQAECVRLREGQ